MTSPSDPDEERPGTAKARRRPQGDPARPLLRPGHSLPADRGVSRQAHRHRRDRRRRTQHADSTAARMARSQGLRRRRDRMDAVAADAADDRAGEVEQHAQQADVRPALRHRLRRPAGKGNHPGAQGRLHRPVGSVHLHRARARRRARRRSPVAAEPVRLRHRAAHGVLPEDRRRQAHRPRPRIPRDGLLGIGDGSQDRRRHLRELPHVSAARCCANTPRWRTSSTSGSSTPGGGSTRFRTNCASRSKHSWSRRRSRRNRR